MRILHVQKTSGIGGCERQLLEVLPRLREAGADSRVCLLTSGHWKRFAEPLRERGIRVVPLPAGPHVNPPLLFRLARQIRAFGPDLVHTHLVHGDLYGQAAAKIAGVPAVSSVHSSHGFYLKQPYRMTFRVAWSLADRVIAISHAVSSFLASARLVPKHKIRVVHYGIDAHIWRASSQEETDRRLAYRLQDGEVALGVASRLVPGKGHEFLIDSFAMALHETPYLRLLIAGDGPLRNALETHARRKLPPDTFRFLGYVTDMRAFAQACDAFVFPTQPALGEGFGLAALEAMAAGRPVIATAVGPLPEVVQDGVTGFLIPPGDLSGLTEKIRLLASDEALRLRLGNSAHQRAVRDFSLDRAVEGILSVYRAIL